MAMVDGALCVSLGIELTTNAEPKQVMPQVKATPKSEKQENQGGAELWKGLYYGLLDKLIQAKGA